MARFAEAAGASPLPAARFLRPPPAAFARFGAVFGGEGGCCALIALAFAFAEVLALGSLAEALPLSSFAPVALALASPARGPPFCALAAARAAAAAAAAEMAAVVFR